MTITVNDRAVDVTQAFMLTVIDEYIATALSLIEDQQLGEEMVLTLTITATDGNSDPLVYQLDAVSLGKGMQLDAVSGFLAGHPHWMTLVKTR